MRSTRKKVLYAALTLSVVLVMVLAAACAPRTVVIEKEVEKIVTQIVKEMVKETVIVEGTPQVVEKEVTKVIEKEVEVVVEVTPTPEVGALGQVKPVPRNRTMIIGQWGFGANLNGVDSWNPFLSTLPVRNNYAKYVFEALHYTNLNAGENIPWLATGYEYNDDFTEVRIDLRKGVEWADGEPMTCRDVKYSLETMQATEGAFYKGYLDQWLESVECVDDFTVLVSFKSSNPRFYQKLIIGVPNHLPIVPAHIWEGQDAATFKNFDLAQGWPIGTGPYKIVLVTAQQVVYDRRDDWWGAKTGFMELPEPERIIATTASTDEAYAQMYMANRMDYGFAIQMGSFEAAREKNPNLRSWHKEGPAYGAPDGCTYQLVLNNATKFADRNVRLALNDAIDRQQLVELGYQNATHPVVAPISSYILGVWGDVVQPVYDEYQRDIPNPQGVEDGMKQAGWAKNADGFWEKDGQVFEITITTPQWLAPIGPVIAEQFIKAGFDTEEKLDSANQRGNMLRMGEYDIVVFVHCGSQHDPWDTLQEFHSKHNVPVGEPGRVPFGAHRYVGDPEMDEALDYMEGHVPSPSDPQYVAAVQTALGIYLRDLPVINLAEELHVIPANETFWTGWPTQEAPYCAPYPSMQDFTLSIFQLKPTQ